MATGSRRRPEKPPDPAWPPPAVPAERRPERAWVPAIVALGVGCLAVVGAMLPAVAGQRVGDPDTAVFWIGLASGTTFGAAAIALGVVSLARSTAARLNTTALAVIGVLLGCGGLLLSAALAFSG